MGMALGREKVKGRVTVTATELCAEAWCRRRWGEDWG
jgi:hypothetical protein